MGRKSRQIVVSRSPILCLPAELIDLIVNLLAKEDVYSLCKVNSTFNAFGNKRSWRVYKFAFSLHLASLKAACHPIVSNPSRARNIRVLVFAPGFLLCKQPGKTGEHHIPTILPTSETSPASFASISKLLSAALQLLPNVRELVLPEAQLYYPDRKHTPQQVRWLNYVYDIVKEWCQTSALPLTGVYSLADQRVHAPILESASNTLERVILLNSDEELGGGILSVLNNHVELLSKMPNLTHLLYPTHTSQPLTRFDDIQGNGLSIVYDDPPPFPKELMSSRWVLIYFKGESTSRRPILESQTRMLIGDLSACLRTMVLAIRTFSDISNPNYSLSRGDFEPLPEMFHLKYYLERAGALVQKKRSRRHNFLR
ncbi:hypothetical protein DL93DRAFT_2233754 [Clavulina sp. PMI_390]|nr:hypothetical protein DL93DRAFT_2233754 [Clavulina sp. PMI_390]